MEEKLALEEGIAYWRKTGDSMLSTLADSVEELGKLPDETELVELLTFYLVFSMGCKEMKLEQESQNFNDRANGMLAGLQKMGVGPGQYRNFVLARNVDGLYSRIKNLAASRASYRFVELSREGKPLK